MNGPALTSFQEAVGRLWWRILRRRSQKHLPWRRLRRYIQRWFPPVHICHPYPLERLSLSPKVGAGCVSSACPDLRRGSRAIVIPTPTGPQALIDRVEGKSNVR